MSIVGLPNNVDTVSSVLLLGSGFSLQSTNLYGTNPPNGAGLKKHFIEQLKLPADTDYDIQVLAEEFAHACEETLYRTLYNLFHIDKYSKSQEQILKRSWLRIYTTNYDNTVEVCRQRLQLEHTTYNSSDPVPNRFAANSIVHLHGDVSRLKEQNVLDQIVLGESAYVRQYIVKSPWYTQFQSDLKFSSSVFIVGYSLSDYHISALLLENPLISERTFFIQPTVIREDFVRRTQTYGKTLFIGIDGFGRFLKELPQAASGTDIRKLKCFRALDPLRDKKGLRAPTALEIFNLFVFGTFNYSRCAATFPHDTYVVPRTDYVDNIMECIDTTRSVIIDSRLGNGKTIFLYIAFLALAERGYSCFMFNAIGPMFDREISVLEGIERIVILFREYASAQDVLQHLAQRLPKAKFIVEIRTSIFEVRYHEVSQAVPRPYKRVSLNRLSPDDVASFKKLCVRAGISSLNLSPLRQKNIELRDLLLIITKSRDIMERVKATIGPILENTHRRKVLILCMLLSKFHLTCDSSFIRTVTGSDPYHEFRPVKEISDELFETDMEDFRVRSAIFAEFAVRQLLNGDEICNCVVQMAQAAGMRKSVRVYRVLMANLLQYSNLSQLFDESVDASGMIISKVYEPLRWDERINDEPLFWLQYAIAVCASKQHSHLTLAERFIETAYARAALLPGYQTYQIDTQAFRIFLLCEIDAGLGQPVSRMQGILEKLELLNSRLGEDSQRGFVFGVLEYIIPFIQKRRSDLTKQDRVVLTFWLSKLDETLGRLPAEYKARYGSESLRSALASAKQLLF